MADETKVTPQPVKPTVPSVPDKSVTRAKKDSVPQSTVSYSLPTSLDLTEVVALYSAIKQGDIFGAMQRGVRILNELLNPPTTARNPNVQAGRKISGEEAVQYEKIVNEFENHLESMEDSEEQVSRPQLKAGGTPAVQFNIANAIAIFQMVIQIINQFKNK